MTCLLLAILLIALPKVFCGSEEDDKSYLVAILNKFAFVSNGVLIRSDWVLTDAGSVYGLNHIKKLLRVRLGSNNYKKGGTAVPVKDIEYHPYSHRSKADFDVALVQLSDYEPPHPLFPVKLLKQQMNVTINHMTVVSWIRPYRTNTTTELTSAEVELNRLSTLAHLHPYSADECAAYSRTQGVLDVGNIICLDPGVKIARHSGAPVTVNNVLWAVVSSWSPANRTAELEPPLLANQIAAKAILGWIYATMRRTFWDPKRSGDFVPYDVDDSAYNDPYDMFRVADSLVNRLESETANATQAGVTETESTTGLKDATEADANGLDIPDSSNSTDVDSL